MRRPLAILAAGVLALVTQSRTAAACDDDDDDPDACEQASADIDATFEDEASLFDKIELVVGNRMLRGLVIRYDDDDDDPYVESVEVDDLDEVIDAGTPDIGDPDIDGTDGTDDPSDPGDDDEANV